MFAFPNVTLDKYLSIKVLSKDLSKIHVGGKTALAWHGFRHNVSDQATVSARRY
jgi:hypothetical protein